MKKLIEMIFLPEPVDVDIVITVFFFISFNNSFDD
jgi:hypothetical protein